MSFRCYDREMFLRPQDYPSLGLLGEKLAENNIYLIFAVTRNYYIIYKVVLSFYLLLD